mmetsp:Transcript_26113/g.26519  ORF Transcript_26113/g.26519 Transcript_26113/m.26519 type:complete len:121 (-) Transcript_26113:80-442(-)|eukprot:CAMPEP_0171312044 /NCGR_PEP_ID=MMETSP0816-20121228/22350_1 /TAXON_ID=420281 /ORGANISM="Proboscia inermis, Strain CCAP1064/1" /LENGTH=120 /DNA_ID=CAMNT_0011797215 /DNA_START=96 /DNA_END=458 /DNA_ORIENTATION=+
MADDNNNPRKYKCKVEIAFPSAISAKHAHDVLVVDDEISGEKVKRNMSLISSITNKTTSMQVTEEECADNSVCEKSEINYEILNVLRVEIEATEAKLLRVSVSSFYDMLTVVLKCYQEFS